MQLQQRTVPLNTISSSQLKKIECGNSHCLLLFQDGSLYGFGGNEEGQLGIKMKGEKTQFINKPAQINFINSKLEYSIEDIAVGDNFSLILARINKQCQIFQFGLVFQDKYKSSLQEIKVIKTEELPKNDLNIKSIYAFGKRKMFLTYNNDVYLGGIDFKLNKIDNYYLLAHFDNEIVSLSLGSNHCIIMDQKGNIYGIGDNTYGELGPMKLSEEKFSPLKFAKISSPIKKICCGARHTVFLLNNGEVFAMGDNSLGQCYGFDSRIGMPIKVELNYEKGKVVDVFCGYSHNLLVRENGDIMTWGDSSSGKLGYNEEHLSQYNPKLVLDLQQKCVTKVGLGAQMTVIATGDVEISVIKNNIK